MHFSIASIIFSNGPESNFLGFLYAIFMPRQVGAAQRSRANVCARIRRIISFDWTRKRLTGYLGKGGRFCLAQSGLIAGEDFTLEGGLC